MPRKTQQSLTQFWARFDKEGPGGCWIWQGPCDARGYGRVYTAGLLDGPTRTIGAHAMAWRLSKGEILPGMMVLHQCDRPACGNPEHLYLGLDEQNGRDKAERARVVGTVLTQKQVDEIRAAVAAGETQYSVATRFGVTQPTVSRIASGKARTVRWVEEAAMPARQPRAPLTQDEILAIRKRIYAGEPHAAIAGDYGVVRETVTSVAKGRIGGLPPVLGRRTATKLTDDQRGEIRRRYAAGESQRALADAFGVTQQTVSNVVRPT